MKRNTLFEYHKEVVKDDLVINLRESDWRDWRNSLKTLARTDIPPVLIQNEYLQNSTDALTVIGVQPNTEEKEMKRWTLSVSVMDRFIHLCGYYPLV